MREIDCVILAAEPSADYKGSKLIEALLKSNPHLKIAAVAGPKMRAYPIEVLLPMESLQVMGFSDILSSLPRLIRLFFFLRKTILSINPKVVVCIDYPGFHLRLQKHLRRKGFQGKLIHYACPSVWAWGKKRIPLMAENLDLLLTLFPFEKQYFANTKLPVVYVGHPLTSEITPSSSRSNILALFPGSRRKEIERNFPFQLRAAQHLLKKDPTIAIYVSVSNPSHQELIQSFATDFPIHLVDAKDTRPLMQKAYLAIAKSGTVTLELALHETPTVVLFALRPFDVFLAQKIFRISLPFYCIVNIIAKREVFPEFFGPNLTQTALNLAVERLWGDQEARKACIEKCAQVRDLLFCKEPASVYAARCILESQMI